MSVQVNEHMMFFTPSYSTDILNIDNRKIENEIYQFKDINDSVKKSNFGGWQSNDFTRDNMFYGEETTKLIYEITSVAKKVGDLWGIDGITLNNFWFNVNNKKDFNYPHVHTASIFSAVYYVKCDPNSGRIIFNRPDDSFHYIPPSAENSYRWTEYYFEPKENMLVVFPSYVEHYVEPSNSEFERISIAVNFEKI